MGWLEELRHTWRRTRRRSGAAAPPARRAGPARRLARYLALAAAALLLGVALAAGTAAWLLARGPVHLAFLTPYLEQVLNGDGGELTFGIGDTVLIWVGPDRQLDVRGLDVSVVGSDGRLLANLPEIAISLDSRALFRGLLRPTRLEVFGASVSLVRRRDGSIGHAGGRTAGAAAADADPVALLLADLAAGAPSGPLADLRHVGVVRAGIAVDDRLTGTVWQARDASIGITRRPGRLSGVVGFDISAAGLAARIDGEYDIDLATGAVAAELAFGDLPPALLPRIWPQLAGAERLAMALSGRLAADVALDGTVAGAELELRGGPGTVSLPEFYPQPFPVGGLELHAAATENLATVDIGRLRLDLDGPKVDVAAQLTVGDDAVAVVADISARDIPAAALPGLWPESVAVGGRSWIIENMAGGMVDVLEARIDGSTPLADPSAFALAEIGGRLAVSGFDVHYLRPLPPITGIGGTVTFDADSVAVATSGGAVGALAVGDGTVDLLDLNSDLPIGHIEAEVAGPLADTLALLDSPPLEFLGRLGLDAAGIAGRQRTGLAVTVPLLAAAKVDDVDAVATAQVDDFSWATPPFGPGIDGAALALQVDTAALSVDGRVRAADSVLDVRWDESFDATESHRTRLEASGTLGAAARAAWGLSLDPWVSGPVGIGAVLAIGPDGGMSSALQADLTAAALDVPELAWSKPPGTPAEAYAELGFDGDVLDSLPAVRIDGAGLSFAGAVGLRRDTAGGAELDRISLDRLQLGGTNVFGTVETARDGALRVVLGGESMDLHRLLEDSPGDDGAAAETEPADGSASPPILVEVLPGSPLGRVRIGEDTVLTGVSGEVLYRDGAVRRMGARAGIGDGVLSLTLSEQDGTRSFRAVSEDAGALLDGFDVTDRIEGGRLEVTGVIDSADGYRPVDGRVAMEDFSVRDAPALARILSMASLSGLADTLAGDGLAFERLDTRYRLDEADNIEVIDAIASGPGLGISGNGTVSVDPESYDLAGEVAPAYGVSRMLGRVPLLGTILAGESGAVLAATYEVTGPADDVSVSVNPLSVLTPGIIRRLFSSGRQGGRADGEAGDGDDGAAGTE